jgi:hypothetical protein
VTQAKQEALSCGYKKLVNKIARILDSYDIATIMIVALFCNFCRMEALINMKTLRGPYRDGK